MTTDPQRTDPTVDASPPSAVRSTSRLGSSAFPATRACASHIPPCCSARQAGARRTRRRRNAG